MAVKLRSSASTMNTAGTSSNSITVTKPSQTADGDLMIAVTTGAVNTITPPAGWTLVATVTATDHQSAVYKKIASSEGASYVWGFSTSDTCGVMIHSFMGARDLLHWAYTSTGSTNPSVGLPLDAARDAVWLSSFAWRDSATATMATNLGSEVVDTVSNNTGATIFRGLAAYYYGPPTLNDIVNIGDQIAGATITQSQAVTRGINWSFLVDDKAPDTEKWSSTDGDFAVELELDRLEEDAVNSVTNTFQGDITGLVSAVTSRGENLPNEGDEELTDGQTSTKWLDFSATSWVQYDFGSGVTKRVQRYRLTSASDAEARDPMNWTLQGSNNGTDFTVVDTRTNESFGNRLETREFVLNGTPGAYRYYRLDITANKTSGSTAVIQLAEFRVSDVGAWEDITSYVTAESKIRITRGLQGASGRSDFSRAYFELNNTDGRFSIGNQDGIYYGALQRNTPCRISKAYGTLSLRLQGDVELAGTNMCGDGVRCPQTAALALTGDLDVRLDLEPESWRQEQALAGVAVSSSLTTPWKLSLLDDGRLEFRRYDGSTQHTYTSTETVPTTSSRRSIKVTLDVDNGASGSDVVFYTAEDSFNGTWIKLGDTVTNTGTTATSFSGGALCVGHVGGQNTPALHGSVYNFELRNSSGTLVSDIDFTALTAGAHSFSENDNRWVTVNNAVVTNRHYRFHGEVPSWPVEWDTTGNWIVTQATGAGVQKRLERSSTGDQSAMFRYHTKGIIQDPGAFEQFAMPAAYWPMENLGNVARVPSGLPGGSAMMVYGNPDPEGEAASEFPESGTLLKANSGKFSGRVSGATSGYTDLRWIMYAPTDPAVGTVFVKLIDTGIIKQWTISYASSGNWVIDAWDEDDLETGAASRGTANFAVSTNGEPMHVRFVIDSNSTNVDVSLEAYDTYGTLLGSITDNLLLCNSRKITSVNLNDGSTAEDDIYFGHVAVYGNDSPEFAGPEMGAYRYETTGNRIARLSDEEGIEFRYVGSLDESAFLGAQEPSAVFPQMSSAAVSDDGYLVDPLDSFGLEYRTNRSLYNQPAHLTLSYTGNELSGNLRPSPDDALIVNDFTASRGNGGSTRYQLGTGKLSVANPPDGVGSYADSQSYDLAHSGQTIDIASWQVHRGTIDEPRYPNVEVALENLRIEGDTALTEAILRMDVGKRLDITDTEDFMGLGDIRQVVVGYEETFDNFTHGIRMNTVPERVFEVAEYDHGWRFDIDGATLTTDVSSSATSLPVTIDVPPGFSGEPEAAPYDLTIGGEVVRVLGVGDTVTPNPLFTTDLTGWAAEGGTTTAARDTLVVHPDPVAVASAKVTPDGVTAAVGLLSSMTTSGTVTALQNYYVSAWVYSPTGYSDVRVEVDWYTAGGASISTSSATTHNLDPGVWTFIEEAAATAPSTATRYRLRVRQGTTPAASNVLYVWNAKLTENAPFEGTSDTGDSFNRANSALTLGSTDRGTVKAWTANLNTWGISSNQAYSPPGGNAQATITGVADFDELYVECPTWPATREMWLQFRFSDTSNRWRWGGTLGANPRLEKVVAGAVTSYTAVRQGNPFTLAAGATLMVRAHGSVIEVFLNGVMCLTISDTFNESATSVGLQTASNDTRFENFRFIEDKLIQTLQVERGINGVTKYHKAGSGMDLTKRPYRGM
jgi:hypothetical protein